MKDSQHVVGEAQIRRKYIKANNERFSTLREQAGVRRKYIKANNERFSTRAQLVLMLVLSISRRIMKDSQLILRLWLFCNKYIKANNERFSTVNRAFSADQ